MKGTESGIRAACLGDVAEFINGVAFKPEDWGEEGSRIIRIQNLTDPSKPYNRTVRRVPERYHVIAGDLLVSWSASLGVFEWVGPDVGLLNQHIFRVIPGPEIDKRYLRYCLEIALEAMGKHLHGATMQHVNRGEFLGTRIPLPPLPEQRRIAAILDQADALRTKRRQALARLDTLTQSIFLEMFGDPRTSLSEWIRRPLSEMCEIVGGLVDPTKPEYSDMDHFGSDRIARDTGELLPAKTAREDGVESPKFLFDERDVLYSKIRPALNKVALARGRGLCSADIYPLRPITGRCVRAFLWRVLLADDFLDYTSTLSNRANIPKVNRDQLMGYQAICPPLVLQEEFERRAGEVERLRNRYRASLARLDSLFTSLQYRAFRGEL